MFGFKSPLGSGSSTRGAYVWLKRGIILVVVVGIVTVGPYAFGKLNRLRIRLVGDAEAREIVAHVANTPHAAPTPDEEILAAATATVNRIVPDVPFTDLSGNAGRLREYKGKVLVISVTSIGCPVSKKATPALARLAEQNPDGQVQFLMVNPDPGIARGDLEQHATQFPGWRYVYDGESKLAAALGARTTTETFVVDESQTLRYRGAVDNRFDVGSVRQALDFSDYLNDALMAVKSQKKHFPQITPAPGCVLKLETPVVAAAPVTWHNQIARFVQANCLECHRPGEAAPFALETYDQVRARKGMIASVLEDKIMPPWFAVPADGHWRNDRTISDADRQMVNAWIDAGCPEGDAADAPVAWKWQSGWAISTPDTVLEVPAQQVPAEGFVPWRKMPVDFEIKEDMWVSEAQIKPSVPEVVHHAMLFVEYAADDPRGAGQTRGEKGDNGGSEGYWLSYFPGRKCMILPTGRGKLLPKGGKVYIQLHYNPNGTAVEDKTVVGLKFLPAPPEKAVVSGGIVKGDFVIPPNSKTEFIYSREFSEDVRLVALMPHMHSRGAAAAVYLKNADGRIETLLNVPKYDFDWQVSYEFEEPLLVAKGSRIVIKHSYDNTADNPDNPDPSKEVHHGNATSDEMMINFFEWEPAGDAVETGNPYRPFR